MFNFKFGFIIMSLLNYVVPYTKVQRNSFEPHGDGKHFSYFKLLFMWSDFVFMWSDFVLKWSDVKWVTVKFLGKKLSCILGWTSTESIWLYCDYFIWCVSWNVAVLTCFVMCRLVHVEMFWQLCGCFGNMCTCIYCVLYCLVYVHLFLFVSSLLM